MFTDGETAILCFVVIPACYGYPLHKNNRTAPQSPTSRNYHGEYSEPSLYSYIHHIPQRRHYQENYGQHYEDDHYENPIHHGYPHNYDHEEHSQSPDHDWHHGDERHFHDHYHHQHSYPEIEHDHYEEDENNHYDYHEPYHEHDHHHHHDQHHHTSPWTFMHQRHHPHYHYRNNDYYHNGKHHYDDEYPHSHNHHHHEYHSHHYPEHDSWHEPLFEDLHHDEHEFAHYNDHDDHGGYSWGHIDTSPYDYTAIVHGYEGHQDGYAYRPDYLYDNHHPLNYDIGHMGHHVDDHLGDLHHLEKCHGYWYHECFPHFGGERGKAEQNSNAPGFTQFQSSGFFQNPSPGPAGSYPEFSKASLSGGGQPGFGPTSPASEGGGAFRKPGLGGHGPYPGPTDKNASPQIPPTNLNPAEVLTSSQL